MTQAIAKLDRPRALQMFEDPGFRSALEKQVDKKLSVEKLLEVSASIIVADDNLRKATPGSVLAAVLKAARYGVLPVGTREGGYLIARWNKKANAYVAQFQSSYIGDLNFIRRAMRTKTAMAEVIREKDRFAYRPAHPDEPILHEVDVKAERGPIIGAYAIIRGLAGELYFRVIDREDIERSKARSEGLTYRDGNPNLNSPWHTDEVEMVLKTAVHRVAKLCPIEAAPWDQDEADEDEADRRPAPKASPAVEKSVDTPAAAEEAGPGEPAQSGPPAQAREVLAEIAALGFDEQAVRDEAALMFDGAKLEALDQAQLGKLRAMFGRAKA